MEINDRIQMIVSELKLSNRAFANRCGLSQSTFDKQVRGVSSLSADVINAILTTFPDISAEWLMRGEGEMRKDKQQEPPSSDAHFERLMKLVDTITTLQDALNTKSDTIAMLKERVAQLENQLKHK